MLILGLLQWVFRASVRAASTSADVHKATLVTARAVRVRIGDHGLDGAAATVKRLAEMRGARRVGIVFDRARERHAQLIL